VRVFARVVEKLARAPGAAPVVALAADARAARRRAALAPEPPVRITVSLGTALAPSVVNFLAPRLILT
jgi:hypothetical protein